MPTTPNFNISPANKTDPNVVDSTCASGNQIWKGTKGNFLAKVNMIRTETVYSKPMGIVLVDILQTPQGTQPNPPLTTMTEVKRAKPLKIVKPNIRDEARCPRSRGER